MDKQIRKEIVKKLLESGEVKTSGDISNIMLDLQSIMYQDLLEAEMDILLKESKNNKRNGYAKKPRKVRTKSGTADIHMPRDRKSEFEPKIIKHRQRVVDDFSDMAILLYSKGNTLNDIAEIIKGVYKINLSKSYLSDLISIISEDIKAWQERVLKSIYAIAYIDALYCTVKVDGLSKKVAVYVMIGIDLEGKKEVIGMWISDGSESASYWLGILEEIKNRGVEDILYIALDGLKGLEEAIELAYPHTKVQRCIVHLVRNLYKVSPRKDSKEIINDFKKIYKANDIDAAKLVFEDFKEKHKKHKTVIKRAEEYVNHIYPLYYETPEIRRLIYTTNTVESVNSCLRKVTKGKGMFMNKESLLKVLYLRIKDLEKKWSVGTTGWNTILNSLITQYGGRVTKHL